MEAVSLFLRHAHPSLDLGNDPVILSGTAFLVYYTQVAELDPKAWIMAEFAAANTASMVLFVGNPTNVVICEGFSINNAAFTAYTILPFVACNLVCFAALAFQFRNQVPRKLTHAAHLDPRSALLDPVGAWVGSCILGAALILCLVVSFFGIDVWMISLPFAVGKFLFDLGWDHYRYTRGILMLGRELPRAVEEGLNRDSAVERHQHTEDTPSHHPLPTDVERSPSFPPDAETAVGSHPEIAKIEFKTQPQPESETVPQPKSGTMPQPLSTPEGKAKMPYVFRWHQSCMEDLHDRLDAHFPTLITALPRLPFALVSTTARDG